MEGSADVSVSEPVEHSVAAPHIKRKENDEQLPQQRDTDNALENADQVTIPRSPENFMETLAGKDLSHDQGSASDPGMMVEELTLNNYKSPILFKGEGSSVKKGFWNNFTRLAGEPRSRDASLRSSSIGYREGVGSLFMPQMSMRRPPGSTQLEPSPSKVADHLAESDHRIASRSMLDKPVEGIRTKVLPASGFSQFLVKNSLRRKGVAYKHPGIRKEPWGVTQSRNNLARSSNDAEVDTHSSEKPSGKHDDKTLIGGGGQADTRHDEISLREWLTPRLHKLDKFERLQMFKQILELVDSSHSQGLILQCLRPTYILISPSNQVKYVGAFVPRSQMEQLEGQHNQNIENYLEPHLKRKKYWWHDDNSSSSMHQKLGESYKPHVLSGGSALQQPTLEFLKLEEKWYASPEELNMGTCSFSSNIYGLGVLLFELFCYFDTWELHSAAMSDLRYRILPPNFLSESPKEAGFCLWLLHPESSSRPNSRDILLSNFVSEGQDMLSPDDSAAIDEEDAEADLLFHFLLSMKEQKEKQAAKLEADVQRLTGDIEEVERRRPAHGEGTSWFSTSILKEERLIGNLDQLENAYFSMRSKIEPSESDSVSRSDSDVLRIRNGRFQVQNDTDLWKEPTDSLGSFFEGLCKYARYSKFELCGSLRSVDILNSANVICSLSFDRDEDYFAAAGVSKKIKIFEFGALLNDSVDIHYPLIEMSNRSKLSCVCWNNYIKNYLASTDYEGVVQLWDASTGQGFTQYIEHQKRAWSVDFSIVDPTRLASGSDDCSVKLWSINERNCTDTIRNVANVCCVQFSPYSSHLLAFGSADYKIYCFDLRMTRVPWCTLGGHGKAVSYVKFVDSVTAVSASTDNSLKLWDLNKTNPSGLSTNACSLSFSGHTNEKNFVGLSVSDGYITCGSETNEVYAYYRTLPMPITSHKFGSTDPITGQETDDDNGQFVSSVCWRERSKMVIAANSAGTIKLLQMV
ncbi:uncharacterized protein A4U43_C05F27290 [Asparagus officinalis]|uniref:Uncharacterized protein n=1 Tax=Asparagus officinalis TaxID=4686 RepID=A0A5P1EZD3_ASPOF|nr:protein SPA1-RELATED 2-like [Asparagus officinalis]ONK69841.1 uncharacterized protein A4U43_C05F27290 [Asparagus officinalis]